jgi:hypothetical protein
MTLSLTHILILLSGFGAALYFFAELRVREIALESARAHCTKMGVQFLDQSVGSYRVWLKRGKDKKLHIWRSYQFEFASMGDERYTGNIITLGKLVESIQLQAHKLPAAIDSMDVTVNGVPVNDIPSNGQTENNDKLH